MAGNIKELVHVIVNSTPRLAQDVFGREWPEHSHAQHTGLDADDHLHYMTVAAGDSRHFTGDVYFDERIVGRYGVGESQLRFDDHYRWLHTDGGGDWDQDGIDLSGAPGQWQTLYDAVGGVKSIIEILQIAVESGSDYWARDGANGVLYPITDTDTLRVGQGTTSYPSLAFKDHNNYGLLFDPSDDAIVLGAAGEQRLRMRWEDDPWYRVNLEVYDNWSNNKFRILHDKNGTASRFYYSGISDVLSYYETIVQSPSTTSSYWYTECTGTSSGNSVNWWEAKSSGTRSAYAYWVASSDNSAFAEVRAQGDTGIQVAGIYAIQNSVETSVWVDASVGHINYWSEDKQILVMQYTTMTGNPANLISGGNDTEELLLWNDHTGSGKMWLANWADDDSRVYFESESQSTGFSELYITSTAAAGHASAFHYVDSDSDYAEYYVNVQSLGDDADIQLRAITGSSGGDATVNILAEAAGATSLANIYLEADDIIGITGDTLYIEAETGIVHFADGYIGPSTYTFSYISLADAVSEYSTFYSNFGAVSVVNAINQAAGMSTPPFLEENEIAFGDSSDEITSSSELYYTGQVFSARAIATSAGVVASYLRAQNDGAGNSLVDINAQADTSAISQILIRTLGGSEGAVINMQNGGMLINTDDYLQLYAEDGLRFEDENHTGSTWSQGYALFSDSTDGWDDYELAHGEVGLLEGIAHGGFVGRLVENNESEGDSSTTSTSFQEKVSLNFTAVSGVTYKIEWYAEIGKTADTDVEAQVELNDGATSLGSFNWKNQPYATRYTQFNGYYISDSLSGSIDIDMDYRVSYGGGTAYIRKARLLVTRLD